jgi:hypothetical protein
MEILFKTIYKKIMNKIYIDNYLFQFEPNLSKIEIDEWGGGKCKIIIDKKYHENLNESLKDDNQIYIVNDKKIWKTINPEVHLVCRMDQYLGIDIKGDLVKIEESDFNFLEKQNIIEH